MSKVFMSLLSAGCSLWLTAGALAQTGAQESQSSPPGQTQQSQPSQQQQQQQAASTQPTPDPYIQQIMDPDKFKELKVKDAMGEEVGTVDQVILDAKEGRIGYVLIKTGATLGMGGEQVIIPWSAIQFQDPQQAQAQQGEQQQQGGEEEPFLALSVPKDQLMEAPQGELQENLDRKHGELIHQYYGVSPYWEESQGQQGQQQQPPAPPSPAQQTQPLPPGEQQPQQPLPPGQQVQ